MNGNHVTGKIVYIDWPGWAGRAQKDGPGGASVLNFSSDKDQYSVNEDVVLTIPTGKVVFLGLKESLISLLRFLAIAP